MTEFSLNKPIAFCYVNIKLLVELESFILDKVPTLVNVPEDKLKERYEVSISEDFGTEEFNSIKEYSFELLPDRTKEIDLKLNMYSPKALRIRVHLKRGETEISYISIVYDGENSKMLVKNIYEHIETLLHQHCNHNRLFHPLPYGFTTIFALGISLTLSIISIVSDTTAVSALIYFLSALLCISYAVTGIWLRPIISFESKHSKDLDSFSRWAFGVLVMLIVSILGTAIWELASH